jgi:hypothetical protein
MFLRTYNLSATEMTASTVNAHVSPISMGPRPRSLGLTGGITVGWVDMVNGNIDVMNWCRFA